MGVGVRVGVGVTVIVIVIVFGNYTLSSRIGVDLGF